MTTCSVVVVSYFTGPVLFACIRGVLRQQALANLIVVDNGNPPDVLARLQQMALSEPRLKIVTGQGNAGFAKGCNLGAKQAVGDFLLLLNPDCLLPPNALADCMAAFGEIPGAMLAGCWLINSDGSEQRGGRRQLLTPKTALSEMFGLHRIMGAKRLNAHETPMPERTHEVPAISGAFMCIRKRDYDRLLGLDESFFLHVEDLDFCMRVNKIGGKVICVPSVKVTHMLSTSGETTSSFIEWHKARGFMRYFSKHFQGETMPGLLMLANLGIVARFALKVAIGRVRAKLRPQKGKSVASRRLMVLASGFADLPETRALYGTTVLVTGATSQVGLCVTRRLLAAGASILALSRDKEIPFQHERLRWLKGDLTDKALSLQDYYADMLVHCAPLWSLPPAIELLDGAGVKRVVAFGSTSVFGKAMSKNAYEKEVVEKLRLAEAEVSELCTRKNMRWTIFRPTLIYGAGLDRNVSSLAHCIRRFRFFPVYPPASGRRHPVHADDLAMAVMQSLQTPASYDKSYNLSGGETLTYREMLERIFTLYGLAPRIVELTALPFALDMAGLVLRREHLNGEIARRMNDDLVFFHDDAARDFGFSPRPFLSGGLRDIEGY